MSVDKFWINDTVNQKLPPSVIYQILWTSENRMDRIF